MTAKQQETILKTFLFIKNLKDNKEKEKILNELKETYPFLNKI